MKHRIILALFLLFTIFLNVQSLQSKSENNVEKKKINKLHFKKNLKANALKRQNQRNETSGNYTYSDFFISGEKDEKNEKEVDEKLAKYIKDTNRTGIPLVSNSIGRQVFVKSEQNILLTSFPFVVNRCDQIIKFKAKFIPEMDEYRNREDAWFTITAMYVNMFKDENSDHLIRSILMSESPTIPKHIRGARPCLIVNSPLHGDKDIPICFETVIQEKNILDVLSFFKSRCIQGLEKINKLALTKAIINCGGKRQFVDPKSLLRRLQKKYYRNINIKNKNWFHPGSDRVPGTNPPKPKPIPAILQALKAQQDK